MDIIQIIVMVMVVTILATITLAAISYGAFKVRERRMPAPAKRAEDEAFFERVRVVAPEASPGS